MKVEMKIKPFWVPSELNAEPRPTASSSRPIDFNEISPEDLGRLCDDFKRAVFDKAGFSMPPIDADPSGQLDEARRTIAELTSSTIKRRLLLKDKEHASHFGLQKPYLAITAEGAADSFEDIEYRLNVCIREGSIKSFTEIKPGFILTRHNGSQNTVEF